MNLSLLLNHWNHNKDIIKRIKMSSIHNYRRIFCVRGYLRIKSRTSFGFPNDKTFQLLQIQNFVKKHRIFWNYKENVLGVHRSSTN